MPSHVDSEKLISVRPWLSSPISMVERTLSGCGNRSIQLHIRQIHDTVIHPIALLLKLMMRPGQWPSWPSRGRIVWVRTKHVISHSQRWGSSSVSKVFAFSAYDSRHSTTTCVRLAEVIFWDPESWRLGCKRCSQIDYLSSLRSLCSDLQTFFKSSFNTTIPIGTKRPSSSFHPSLDCTKATEAISSHCGTVRKLAAWEQ